jgi:hypothetical protein
MTAVMRRAEDRRNASIMISISIRWSLAGYDVDWRTNTSSPRTFSWISTKISWSAKRLNARLAQRDIEIPGDGLGQHPVRIARKKLHEISPAKDMSGLLPV